MKILIACEMTGIVTAAFRRRGHAAYSCDVRLTRGPHPAFHIWGDVRSVLDDPSWDMIIGFPPCTNLALSGSRLFAEKRADGRQQEAIGLFLDIASAPCRRIAIENPIGIMSGYWRKPDQIVQPYYFGDPFEKRTCLWLKGLPRLQPTKFCLPGDRTVYGSGRTFPAWMVGRSSNGRARWRSDTFPGLADAMADQWGRTAYLERCDELEAS